MAIQEFLGTRQVFTSAEFARTFPDSQTDRNLLSRAVRRGGVDRVRRGLYVSKTGQFSNSEASPLDIAAAVAPDAIFAFTSALQLHGVLHNLTNLTQFFTAEHLSPFSYRGQDYLAHRIGLTAPTSQTLLTASGKAYRATTREQTLVDCLAKPRSTGGLENLLRSLGGLTHIDAGEVARLAEATSLSTKARLGWVLETRRQAWRIDDAILSDLRAMIDTGPSYFWSSTPPKDHHWVNAWKLYLPEPEEEMASWLNE